MSYVEKRTSLGKRVSVRQLLTCLNAGKYLCFNSCSRKSTQYISSLSRERVCQRSPKIVPVRQTQHNSCISLFFSQNICVEIESKSKVLITFVCVCVFALQPHMPLFSIYSLALEQDQEQSVGLQMATTTLHNQTFIQVMVAAVPSSMAGIPPLTCRCLMPPPVQPLVQRYKEHEKKRKEIKEHWIRAKRKLVKPRDARSRPEQLTDSIKVNCVFVF